MFYHFSMQVGAIQNSIAVATTEPIDIQRDGLHQKLATIIKAASLSGVNVLCLQEAWSKKYNLF